MASDMLRENGRRQAHVAKMIIDTHQHAAARLEPRDISTTSLQLDAPREPGNAASMNRRWGWWLGEGARANRQMKFWMGEGKGRLVKSVRPGAGRAALAF